MSLTTSPGRGCDWLTSRATASPVLTPEGLTDEHRLIARTAAAFVRREVTAAEKDLDRKDWSIARRLLRQAGALGFIGADVPESLGGGGLDLAAAVLITEALGASPSFATAFGAQAGLALVPIVTFGTPEQHAQYLGRLIAADLIGAYALSESESGSDAFNPRTTARSGIDGSWILNGEKMWVTNGGFADIFIVFANAGAAGLSVFVVERTFPGVSAGAEEHKMGLDGSSTTPLVLAEAKVPAGNLLGQAGDGRRIAFTTLNYGRIKLAATCSGTAKAAIAEAAGYASARRQFGQPIATFGAIRHKLAEMTIREYAVESALYRTAGLVEAAAGPTGDTVAMASALGEFGVESSILKIAASEMLGYVTDELVQIHGGNGFVRDYPAERRYRDARINRIFEGTNEINRLLVPTMLIKRARQPGRTPLESVRAIGEEMRTAAAATADERARSSLDGAMRVVAAMKRAARLVLGVLSETWGDRSSTEQECLALASDVVADTFLAESVVLRASQAAAIDDTTSSVQHDAATVFVHDAAWRAGVAVRTALAAVTHDSVTESLRHAIAQTLDPGATNTIGARRRIADAVTIGSRYPLRSRP